MRHLVWFSCGAASAVTAKLLPESIPVYCDTSASEHPDNLRFLADVEIWLGRKVHLIKNASMTTIDAVFEQKRYMSGIAGARCTVELKKIPRFNYQLGDDLHSFGFTYGEQKRADNLRKNNPELNLSFPLIDHQITKADCFQILTDACIELPIMYSLGYRNNNCLGCVKATSPRYWAMIRDDFPVVFQRRAEQSRVLGVRLVILKGERIFLDELPSGSFKRFPIPDIACGPECATK